MKVRDELSYLGHTARLVEWYATSKSRSGDWRRSTRFFVAVDGTRVKAIEPVQPDGAAWASAARTYIERMERR
jgi:hypothetical protein